METSEEAPATDEQNEQPEVAEETMDFDAVDLMLHGNLQAQIRYGMIKGMAEALDEKAQLLIEAESNFEPQEDETFAEIALPEIEAMASAVTEEWIDFSKLRFWETCQTAEVEWEEYKDENEVAQRVPYSRPLEEPKDGNRILANLEKIHLWLEQVHHGTSRVLIQQLDPPADILVREMKAGERAEVVVRGSCKLFCSAREFVHLDNNGTMVEITDNGPGVIEF